MTIFKNINDGRLYAILYKDKNGVRKHTAVPYGHSNSIISDCDLKDFVIETIKNGGSGSFL